MSSMTMRPPAPRGPEPETIQLRQFKGVNRVDSRVSIEDSEFAWLENAMTIGNGAIQILNGPGAAVATFTEGVARFKGFVLNGAPVFLVIGNNGAISQVTPGGVVTVVSGANAVTTDVVMAIWRGTEILFLDPQTGYSKWDGTTYTVLDATMTGTALAVFQGRAWLFEGRTITFTAPNSNSDFSLATGAGSTIITDEAFAGDVVQAISALEQLWVVGASSVEAIANVVSTGSGPVVTTFSITNIVTNIGTTAQFSVVGYLRSLAFLAPFGAYALAGVTPQKISEKLDGLFPDLTITTLSCQGCVAVVQNLLCLIFRVQYNGQLAQAGAGPRALLLLFANGKWCFASQGAVTWITDVVVNGVAQAWATDGATIFQMFAAPRTTAVAYKIQWKLSDFGRATVLKQCLKTGLEFQAALPTAPAMVIENESSATETANLRTTVPVTWVNNAGDEVTFVNNSGDVVTWVAQGMVLSRQVSNMWGAFLGFTITGEDPPYLIQGIQLQILKGPDAWLTPVTSAGV
jgi:hypothetical protein